MQEDWLFGDTQISENVWSPATGEGLERADVAAAKAPLVRLALASRLNESCAWLVAVARVHLGDDPFELASAYGHGSRRRRAIGAMLLAAASGRPHSHAWTVHEPAQRSSYRYSTRFWAKVLRGVECIVRLGDGECFECGCELRVRHRTKGGASGRSQRVLYCDACEVTAEPEADRHAIELVFSELAAGQPTRP